jgi:hypothetical protein
MRRRRTILLAAALVLAVLLLVGYWVLVPRGPSARITRAAYERVRLGMTAEEAQAVIGLPPGDYRTAASATEHAPADENEAVEGLAYGADDAGPDPADWMGDDACIWLDVDPERGVVAKHFGAMRDARPTISERIRGWLGL